MITTLPITKARINLGSIARRARVNKEYFILEKDGYPVAGIMDIDEFEDYLDANNQANIKQIKQSSAEYASGKSRPASSLLKELKSK